MEPENLDMDSIMGERRAALEQSARLINVEELKTITAQLFQDFSHPWKDAIETFIAENPHGTFCHAVTNDKVHLVYSREKDKGFWYIQGGGMGILMEQGLSAMRQISSLL